MNAESRNPAFYSDREVLELFKDDPELLGLVDAIAQTQASPRRSRSRTALLVAVIALAIVSAGALALWPSEGRSGVIDRALRAIERGQVLHAIYEQRRPEYLVVDLVSGREHPTVVTIETWFDETKQELRSRTRRNGTVVADVLITAASTPLAPGIAPEVIDFTRGYRAALQAGHARVLGGDRPGEAARLSVRLPSRVTAVTLNPTSFEPASFRAASTPRHGAWRIRSLDARARNESDFQRAASRSGAVRGSVRSRKPAGPSALTTSDVRVPRRVGKFVLERVFVEQLTTQYADRRTRRSRGLRIVYRRAGARAARLVIQVARHPEPAYGFTEGRLTVSFNPIPLRRSIDLARLAASPREQWVGQFRLGDSFITITGTSKAATINAARALAGRRVGAR